MDPLSKKLSLVRYSTVLVAMCAVAVGVRGLKPTSFLGVVLFALLSLKYPFFDSLIRMTRRRWPSLKVLPWLWIGYTLAAGVDIAATWIAMSDDSGANLALSATVLIAPCFLACALVLMVVHTLITRKR